jgi:hypothetical protein
MIKIAHRGNINGKTNKENHPDYLVEAIKAGFDVELDLWMVDCSLWLGHDRPTYKIDEDFLIEIGGFSWIHCKNLEALSYLSETFPQLNYFWHQEDDYTLTSQGFIWTYPGKDVGHKSVIVDLEPSTIDYKAYGVCSDWEKHSHA